MIDDSNRACLGSSLDKSAAQREAYKIMPDDELFIVQEVLVDIPDYDQPGRPVSRVVCAICGEGINDRREVRLNGQILCRACAQGAYYQGLRHSAQQQNRKTTRHLKGKKNSFHFTYNIT